jgi:hypothetical protein
MAAGNEYQQMVSDGQQPRERRTLAFLLCFHAVICCVSLVYVAQYYNVFHIFYDPARLSAAIAVVAAFVLVSSVFLLADFSFGYFVGFYFYTMVLGYLWVGCFSDFDYNHRLGGVSAAASAIADDTAANVRAAFELHSAARPCNDRHERLV